MSTKVLVLSSSPRIGGNSDLICDALIKGVKYAGNEAVKLNIAKMCISPCLGCDYCQSHEGACVQKDDMEQVILEMQKADIVVFATPIYFYNMSAQLKIVIDRTYCTYQNLHFKKTVFIATSADSNEKAMDTAIAGYNSYLSCLKDTVSIGIITVPGVWNKGEVNHSDVIKKVYELGKSL